MVLGNCGDPSFFYDNERRRVLHKGRGGGGKGGARSCQVKKKEPQKSSSSRSGKSVCLCVLGFCIDGVYSIKDS